MSFKVLNVLKVWNKIILQGLGTQDTTKNYQVQQVHNMTSRSLIHVCIYIHMYIYLYIYLFIYTCMAAAQNVRSRSIPWTHRRSIPPIHTLLKRWNSFEIICVAPSFHTSGSPRNDPYPFFDFLRHSHIGYIYTYNG